MAVKTLNSWTSLIFNSKLAQATQQHIFLFHRFSGILQISRHLGHPANTRSPALCHDLRKEAQVQILVMLMPHLVHVDSFEVHVDSFHIFQDFV